VKRAVIVAALVSPVLGCAPESCAGFESEVLAFDDESLVLQDELDELRLDDGVFTERDCLHLCLSDAVHGPVYADRIDACDVEREGSDWRVSCSWTGHTWCTGRRHAANGSRAPVGARRGAWFAAAAHDEAASVKAFVAIARELARHGAPRELVVRAADAALDEVRHARAMAALAREHNASPLAPRFLDVPARDLLAIALENAVEGCVRETFGVFVAHHQARSASARLRPVFARIAEDETRHAQWSWDLDAWLATRLSSAERRRVAAARRAALAELGPVGPRPHGLGLPSPAVTRRMARRFAAAAS
jgi:hypothetical protein